MLFAGTIRNTFIDKITMAKGSGLWAKSVRAIMKLGAGTLTGHGMKLIRQMFLARLIAPSDLGLMAIVVSLSSAFEALTEVGIKEAVIQNKDGAKTEFLNVTWWMQLIRGFCLFVIAMLLAPWLSSFYEKPELLNLLRVCFLAILFKGLVSPRAYVLEKEYKFGRSVLLIQGSAVFGAIVTVVLAFVLRNVWALVIGFVSEMAILCVFSFVLVPFIPKFEYDRKCLGELLKFARGMFGMPILAFVSINAPILVLGKIVPEFTLGLYSYAVILSRFPTLLYTKVISPVLLPAFSKKQDDKFALVWGILHASRWTIFGCLLLIVFLFCCSSEILYYVYGPEFAAMAVPFGIMSVEILTRNVAIILAGLYIAKGMPHLHRRFVALRALAIVIFIYPVSVSYGVLGASILIILSNFIVLLMQMLGCRKLVGLEFSRYIRTFIPGVIFSVPIILTFDLLWLFNISSSILVLAIGTFVFIVTLIIGVFFMSRPKEPLLE